MKVKKLKRTPVLDMRPSSKLHRGGDYWSGDRVALCGSYVMNALGCREQPAAVRLSVSNYYRRGATRVVAWAYDRDGVGWYYHGHLAGHETFAWLAKWLIHHGFMRLWVDKVDLWVKVEVA